MDENGEHDAQLVLLLRQWCGSEWLPLMIRWELGLDRFLPGGRSRPFYGVRAPSRTKNGTTAEPPRLPVPVGRALAA